MACHFQIAQTAQNVEIKVLVGGKDEQVVGGQTLTVSAAEPSRTPQTFKVCLSGLAQTAGNVGATASCLCLFALLDSRSKK